MGDTDVVDEVVPSVAVEENVENGAGKDITEPTGSVVESNSSPEKLLSKEVTEGETQAPLTEAVLDVLDQKIIRQIEYYFGDANLPNDKFIKAESAKNEGWFPLTALMKFNRIQSLLSDTPEEERINRIVSALRFSVLIDIDEKAVHIRRNLEMPLPEGNSNERTVYIKGFHRNDTRLDDLIEFYSKYDGVDGVIMRWYKEKVILPPKETEKNENGAPPLPEMANIGFIKKFKGSILVVFKSVEQAEAFLKEETHTYGGISMMRLRQKEYREKKKKEFEERQAIRSKGIGKPNEGTAATAEVDLGDIPKGTLLKINDVPDGFTREILKEKFFSLAKEDDFPIAFVDFQRGDQNAVFRLEKGGAAEEAFKLIPDAKLPVGTDQFCLVELFNETDEISYLIKIRDNRLKLKRRGGGRGGFGGRGGGNRGRHGGRGYGKRGRR